VVEIGLQLSCIGSRWYRDLSVATQSARVAKERKKKERKKGRKDEKKEEKKENRKKTERKLEHVAQLEPHRAAEALYTPCTHLTPFKPTTLPNS
jgi:hypothetical protein